MKRIVSMLGLGFGVILAGAQFIQPRLTPAVSGHSHDLLQDPAVDPQVRSILKRSCADCHSNATPLPWYGRVSPVSWLIADHLKRGREKLNLSEWPQHSENERQDIADAVDRSDMPMRSYLLMHRSARLSPQDRKIIERWADSH